MPYFTAKHGSRAGTLCLLALWVLGLLPAPAFCQADSPVHYFKLREFEIPFEMDASRPVKAFHLHASTDGKLYSHIAAAVPASTRFPYTASADGWYSFVVQVEELDGRLIPNTVGPGTPVGLRVCVDTVKPVVLLKAVAPSPETLALGHTVAVEWEVSDANLDLRTFKLQFAIQGSDRWVTLNSRQLTRAQFSWAPVGTGPFDVRLQVSDLAGNTSTALARVAPGSVMPPSASGSAHPGGPRVIYVRTKTFQLNYKTANIGPSSVKHVEVWMTRDTTTWNRYQGVEAPANGPYPITVPTTGRYGFTLRPLSGVGRGPKPPAPLQQPQLWIEVDDKAPVVTLLGPVVVGEGDDSGTITVNWRASDQFLRDRPITILWADKPDGEWKPIPTASGLENLGVFKCPVKDLPFEFFVKVEAVDEAGNKGSAQTTESVKVDLKIPQVKDLDVTGIGVDAAPRNP